MKTKQLAIAVVSLLVIAIAFWLLVSLASAWLRSFESSVSAALVTAAIGLLGLWYAQWHSKGRDIAESHRSSKIEVYGTFFDIVEKLQEDKLSREKLAGGNIPDWLRANFRKLNRGLLLWASPTVIKAWLNFRAATTTGGNILLAMDTMYRAIRKDLGNSNFGLKKGDLVRIALKDPDELKL